MSVSQWGLLRLISKTSTPNCLDSLCQRRSVGRSIGTSAVGTCIQDSDPHQYSAPVGVWRIVINRSVCLCVSVHLSVSEHISVTDGPIVTKFCMWIPWGHGSVLFWRRCPTSCTSGFMDGGYWCLWMPCYVMWPCHCLSPCYSQSLSIRSHKAYLLFLEEYIYLVGVILLSKIH